MGVLAEGSTGIADLSRKGEPPLVTIGVPVYNGERFLADALESLIGQTYSNLEILIADNASTDRTPEISRRVAASDSRVRHLRSGENRGAAWNFNRLVGEARGEFFRWAAADDLVRPPLVERSVHVLTSSPDVVLVYPKTQFIDEEGHTIRDHEDNLHLDQERPSDRYRAFARRIGYCNAAYGLVRTSSLRRTGLLGAFPGSDIVLLGELALHGKFHELPDRLFLRRFHQEAASAKTDAELDAHYRARADGSPAQRAPSEQSSFRLLTWRKLMANLAAVARTPVSVREKARIWAFLLRRAVMSRHEMAREVLEAVRYRPGRRRADTLVRSGSESPEPGP